MFAKILKINYIIKFTIKEHKKILNKLYYKIIKNAFKKTNTS